MVRGADHYYDTGRRLAKTLAEAGLTVLVFCPSRISAERMIARTVKPEDLSTSYVRVYRSGLSAEEREGIENGLRTKQVRLVFSTSALELGIDIGEIDVVLCVGLPHTMMSLWQRAGRAARGGREGATIFIPADTPIDSHYSIHPDELFSRENEPLVLNLHNLRIASQHYACAVQECGGDENRLKTAVLGDEIQRIQDLRKEGKLNHDIFYVTDPHIEVNIRSGGERSFQLKVDDQPLGEIDAFHLLRECYTNAIYRHGGRSYRVLNVLYGNKTIRLKPEFSQKDTNSQLQRKVHLKKQYRVADYGEIRVATVAVDVNEFLLSVTEKDPSGKVVMTWPGASGMRQYRLPTEGTMLVLGKAFWERVAKNLGPNPNTAISATERLLSSLFPTISGPCDTQDYSSAVDRLASGENAIFLYDTVYEGVDLASVAFDNIRELIQKSKERVETCSCLGDEGCFRCIANPLADQRVSKGSASVLLQAILEAMNSGAPQLTETPRDWELAMEAPPEVECSACGHKQSQGAKFCSECGTKLGV